MFPITLTSKRSKVALRFFTYGVMTLATAVLTTLAVFYAMGYRFNQQTFSFEQGGLVQFRSAPEDATVVIDGKPQNFRTPGRANLPAGVHTVEYQRQGYQAWQKSINLEPGQLLWLNYTRLIPSELTTTPARSFATLTQLLASPDKRWLFLQEKPNEPTFQLADIADTDNVVFSTVALPEPQVTRPADGYGRFDTTEWDLSSRFVLVHHFNNNINEWLRVDRSNPTNTINLNRLFGLTIGQAHFAGSNPNIIYVQTDTVLRRLDLGSNSASAALASGVLQFSVYGDGAIAFTAHREATPGLASSLQTVIGLVDTAGKETIIRTLPATETPIIAYTEYDNHAYLAIQRQDSTVDILRDPAQATAKDTAVFADLTLGAPVGQLLFSGSGRMLVAVAANKMATYDLELGRTYSANLGFNVDAANPLRWLDDFYVYGNANGRLQLVEFDGQNPRTLAPAVQNFRISLSPNGETLFSVDKNTQTGAYSLQATQLVLDN